MVLKKTRLNTYYKSTIINHQKPAFRIISTKWRKHFSTSPQKRFRSRCRSAEPKAASRTRGRRCPAMAMAMAPRNVWIWWKKMEKMEIYWVKT